AGMGIAGRSGYPPDWRQRLATPRCRRLDANLFPPCAGSALRVFTRARIHSSRTVFSLSALSKLALASFERRFFGCRWVDSPAATFCCPRSRTAFSYFQLCRAPRPEACDVDRRTHSAGFAGAHHVTAVGGSKLALSAIGAG